MSTIEALLAWSGWLLSAVGTWLTVASMRSAAREQARARRLTATLSRVASVSVEPYTAETGREEAIRALVIRVAAGEQPYAVAQKAARRLNVPEAHLEKTVKSLRGRGLVGFDDPLTSASILTLST